MSVILIGFQTRFQPRIIDGTKRHTIRRPRKDGRPRGQTGDTVAMYTGLRTPNANKFGTAICSWVRPVKLCLAGDLSRVLIGVGHEQIEHRATDNLNTFAQQDGFDDWAGMAGWFIQTHGPGDFIGEMVSWRDFVPEQKGVAA